MATHSAPTSRAPSASPSTGSESPSRASGSRDSVSASASTKGPFYRADTTFNPSPYQPPQRSLPLYRPTTTVAPVVSAVFDTPQATAPPFDGMFIHPPFNNLPEGVVLTAEGMNYSVMHQHPTWFLDIKDYITLDANPDGAVRYPRDLEPPRPRRQKDLLLRCTFCPRTYAGVNAKSMWTRHVREKHRVVLSKAWSDTATSSRRQSTGKTASAATGHSVSPDTATPAKQVASASAPTSAKPASAPKGKPGPKPGPKPAKPASPAKAKKVGAPRKIIIPAQKPKPPPPPPVVTPWVRSLSPPPPVGILPPRMRAFPRKSFVGSQASTELKTGDPSTPGPSSAASDQVQSSPEAGAVAGTTTIMSISAVLAGASLALTPPTEVVSMGVAEASASISSDPTAATPPSQSQGDKSLTEVVFEPSAEKSSEDGDSIETDKEVADLLLMDVDMLVDEPDEEDVDMELEDEEEGLHPPISLGGLAGPVFGMQDDAGARLDPFSLSSRPSVAMSPVFSPALSPAVPHSNEGSSREQSVEQSVEDVRPETPASVGMVEAPEEAETPPLGRFKVSSLAYLIDKNLAVSPPHSPAPQSNRSLPTTDMEDEPPTATMFAAMQDVFVLKMEKMDPELKAKFLGHLQEQFGIKVQEDVPSQQGASDDGARWAALPESVVKQIMSEHASSSRGDGGEGDGGETMAVDALGGEFATLADEFKQDSAGQLKDDLEDQLKSLVSAFTEELIGPLQDALTLQLKNEIIVQVADQMMEALVVQGEEAQVEFEWRRRFLERQLWTADEESEVQDDEVIQHPLHHLFLSKAMPLPADMDVRMPAPLLC
ncbi:hypothetical protein DFH08DRAFT_795710 [Mycena albidolilacea]|uniref:Uncharacterized protein n=1 Tax=Mycena albidolilacea TaxID=1033008 RepID=A0AAD7AT30_9AGAR|nr:hypothetical protein DFH08DRAFT_795710 [Mycena albidolilacea]